jgi:hypothetical protein
MAEKIYQDSTYRFTDPIRFFKANDPYYFEVDNIPLKQLQENCLWLKDQIRKEVTTKLSSVKRADIDELRPYVNGADRVIRVKPGRYTARINDASSRKPLAYLRKVMGQSVGDVDAWDAALPNAGNFPNGKNAALEAALATFQSSLAQDAIGMNGLAERAFTWPVVNSDTPINISGVNLQGGSEFFQYGGYDVNYPGGGASIVPFVLTQALLWAKAQGSSAASIVLPTYETTNEDNGFAKLPKTENYFIKAWRGISRLAIVDVDDELTIEVPQFDVDDFSYTDADGLETSVDGVQQRVDLVFIYSKPVDMSSVNLIQRNGVTTITKPTLGIVRGAGIKVNYSPTENYTQDYIVQTNESILAHPADQANEDMGFNSTSANDISFAVRGSFPSPDDLLNLAPLISERLEDNAYELVGQSILPVAYVFVSNNSQVVLPLDVIDIRPFFRTAELTYNERAGLAAAFPQLSLANPAVGKAQLDHELKRVYDDLKQQITQVTGELGDPQRGTNTLATGYIFGGFNFGPEGALYNFYQKRFSETATPDDDSKEYITNYISIKYGLGSAAAGITIPDYPDWDLSKWCVSQDILDKGLYINDYMNTFIGGITAGSKYGAVTPSGGALDGSIPPVIEALPFSESYEGQFNFVSKKINFIRPSWLADYKVHVDFLNCIPAAGRLGKYQGIWVEKGFDYFTIYIAWPRVIDEVNDSQNRNYPTGVTALATSTGGKNPYNIYNTISNRGLNKYSAFAVLVDDILYTGYLTPVSDFGYVGNPRIGLCTYPTVTWSLEGIPIVDRDFLYGNLNATNPTIRLKES